MATKTQTQPQTENNLLKREAATGGYSFTRVKSVTRPVLKLEFSRPYYIRVETAPEKAVEDVTARRATKSDTVQEPPFLMNVINLETGEEQTIVVPVVLQDTLAQHYPENTFVGRCFEIIKLKVEGKRYSNFSITEIEPN